MNSRSTTPERGKEERPLSLSEQGQQFVNWLLQLKQVASDKTGTPLNEIKINDEAAFSYFKDGFTPTQCFREEWQSDGD